MTVVILMLFLLSSLVSNVSNECYPEPYPEELFQCLKTTGDKASIHDTAGEPISSFCINQFLWTTAKDRWAPRLDAKTFKLISDLKEKPAPEQLIVDDPQLAALASNRSRHGHKLRIRREYRLMTERQKRDFHEAVRKLKEDTSVTPNVYDALANYHRGVTIENAHGGENFLGWHRIYLWLFENALLEKVPTVIFPYWDCTLDQELDNPAQSYMFTEEFAGNGNGSVNTGPFKSWELVRGVGRSGLMSKDVVNDILSQEHHHQIIGAGNTDWRYNLEGHHGGIHMFIGGIVSRLQTASQDPIFFLLHNFVDYVWWRFREEQVKRGVDPEKDYPTETRPGHEPDNQMGGFTDYSNIAGYANNWTSEVYTFERSPECPYCGNSKWLECVNGRCRAKAKGSSSTPSLRKRSQESNPSDLLLNLFDFEEVNRRDRDTGTQGTCQSSTCPTEQGPIQNTFKLNGKADSKEWDFMAVEILYNRPPGLVFDTFRIHDGHVQDGEDVFAFSSQKKTREAQQPLGTYKHCHTSASGTSKVYVNADGLSYEGNSLEYAVVDERLPVSSGVAYVPIKSPRKEETTVIFTAYDECGRLCRPMCKSAGSSSTSYAACSGVVRFSAETSSSIFSSTVAGVVNNVWSVPFGSRSDGVPTLNNTNICIKFVCDSVPLYPWERL